MVLTDSHGYSTPAGTHAVSLAVVIYALLLGGIHRQKRAIYSCVLLVTTVYNVLEEGGGHICCTLQTSTF